MQSPGAGIFRAVRSTTVAVAAVLISLLAHIVGGGSAPSPVAITFLTALATGAVWPVAARPAVTSRLFLLLAAAQVALHATFGVLTPATHHAGHAGHQTHLTDQLNLSWSMLATHAVACLVVAVILTRADEILWRVWTWADRVITPILVLVCVKIEPRDSLVPVVAAPARRFHARGVVAGRGPPGCAV